MAWLLGDVFDESYESDIALYAAIDYGVVGPVHGITAITTEVHGLPPLDLLEYKWLQRIVLRNREEDGLALVGGIRWIRWRGIDWFA